MKKTLTPLLRSGGRSRTGRWCQQALVTLVTVCAALSMQAAIPIILGNNPTIDFATTPAPTEWATFDITVGNSATYTTPAALDTGAQTIDAAVVTTAVGVTAANGTARLARHNTTGGYLVTQPTGVPMAVLMARLQNNTSGDINVLNITYNYTIPVTPVTDEVPGQRAFWSLTGAPNSWTLIPSLSGVTTAGLLTASVGVGSWTSGSAFRGEALPTLRTRRSHATLQLQVCAVARARGDCRQGALVGERERERETAQERERDRLDIVSRAHARQDGGVSRHGAIVYFGALMLTGFRFANLKRIAR